jgi:pimeloyl-ACP methyl ester carboxylesterase
MGLARAGEVQLSYERTGAGEPLLMIMGMSGTALHWGEPFLEECRWDFEVIAYDHRGIGASSRLEGPVTIVQMAQDAAALLEALGIGGAHVLGISMGGMIAQELALARPDLVRTLTLGCTYCGGPGSARTPREVAQRLSEAMMSGDRALALRVAWEVNVSSAMADDQEAYTRFLAIAEERSVALGVIMRQMRAIEGHDTSGRLPRLTVPTLVIHGTEDQLLPVQNGRLIASLIPGAGLELLEDVGHLFFWERPGRSAELLRARAGAPA